MFQPVIGKKSESITAHHDIGRWFLASRTSLAGEDKWGRKLRAGHDEGYAQQQLQPPYPHYTIVGAGKEKGKPLFSSSSARSNMLSTSITYMLRGSHVIAIDSIDRKPTRKLRPGSSPDHLLAADCYPAATPPLHCHCIA